MENDQLKKNKISRKKLLENTGFILIITSLVLIPLSYIIVDKDSNIKSLSTSDTGILKKEYDKLKIYLIISLVLIILGLLSTTAPFLKITTTFTSLLYITISLITIILIITLSILFLPLIPLITLSIGISPSKYIEYFIDIIKKINTQELYSKLKTKENILNLITGTGLILLFITFIMLCVTINIINNNNTQVTVDNKTYISLSDSTFKNIKLYISVILGLISSGFILLLPSKFTRVCLS